MRRGLSGAALSAALPAASATALPPKGDYPAVETSGSESPLFSDSANSTDAVMNVFDLGGAPRHGADRFHVRFGARQDTVRPGALFLQADVGR
ncbi:hypothetical protein ACFQ69_19305 [Streptomyces sp. NPDC056470]|uniref:hypothetical protein n=1 Tax=Streptomyces sp. NPDC056470 TaxID=3345831 RepID=UPI0036A51EF3